MPGLRRYGLLFSLTISLLVLSASSELRAQWVKLAGFDDFYNEVLFFDQNLGFITSHDGSVLRTANGGSTWTTVTLPDASFSANRDISFVSTSDGFISGEDGIWKTTNGGTSWTEITPAGATGIGSSSSWFRNSSVGIWGYGHCLDSVVTFWRTTDGGATWTSVTYTHTPDVAVGGMTYTGGTFYASGSSGKFWKSTDDGATWTLSNTNSVGWQEDLIASPTGALLIASADGTSCGATGGGKLLMSVNGGSTWTTTSYANTVMWGVSMYTGSDGWAVGDFGKAYKTTDGGTTWTENSCGIDPRDRLDDVEMIDATHGFAVGDGIYRFAVNEFTVRPDTINFGDVIVGTTRGDSAALVRAIGTAGTVTARAILGADAAHFASPSPLGSPQVIPVCTDGATLVRFMPTTLGPKLARLEFTITGVPAPLVVYLKGRGVKPVIVGTKSHRLDTLVCETERLDTIVYSNNGDYPLSIDSVLFANNVGNFALVAPATPFQIQPGRNAEFIIRGRAAGAGEMSGRMYVYTNDPDFRDPPWVVDLGMYKKRVGVDVLPDTLVIPSRPPDSTATACLVLKNIGEAEMTSGKLTTTSADPTIFTPFTGPTLVKAGDSAVICFNARALDTLARCKTFRLMWSPCDVPIEIVVCYQAAEGAIDIPAGASLAAGCGKTAYDTILLYNRGNDAGAVTGGEIIGPDKDRFALIEPAWPQSIPAGDSLRAVLAFTPDGTKGTSQGLLVLTLQDGSTDTVALEGILRAPLVDLVKHFNDIGPICPNGEREVTVYLSNSGNDGTGAITVTPIDADDRVEILSRPAGPLLPGATDSIRFAVRGTTVGDILVRYRVTYESSCLEPDTITITGRVLDSSLTIAPVPVDFRIVPVGKSAAARTVLRNNGDTAVTVRVGDPGISGVSVTHPAADVELAPGDTLQVTLLFAPDAAAVLEGMLPISSAGRCNEDYAVAITGTAVDEAVYLSGDLDLGIVLCDQSGTDTVYVYNRTGGSVRIGSAGLVGDPGFAYELPQSVPLDIPAGDSVPVVIRFEAGNYGPSVTRLTIGFDQGPVPELIATIRAERRGTDTRFVEKDGTLLSGFVLPPFSACRPAFDTVLILRNFGNIPDTLDLAALPSSALMLTSSLPVAVPPGESVEVALHVEPTSAVPALAASVEGLSRVCGTTTTASTTVDYIFLEVEGASDIAFGDVCVGRDSTSGVTLRNPGAHPIHVVRAEISGESFTLDSSGPFTLEPGKEAVLPVTFTPVAEEQAQGTLLVITDSPCPDTLTIPLSGEGVYCSIPELVLRAENVRGRWGTVVPAPVRVSGYNIASVQEVRLDVTASTTLLDPGAIRFSDWAEGKWSVADRSYDPEKGRLTLTLRQAVTGAPNPPADVPLDNALFFEIDYTVLRGDSIASPIDLELIALQPDGTIGTEDGEFVLEDYCDAYGRLLQASGGLALRPAVPNPAAETAAIEYEIPFRGHALLSVFDLSGNEVLRLLDDTVPAGRRRVAADLSDIPSGIYTVRLTIGLQQLTQRLVVAK